MVAPTVQQNRPDCMLVDHAHRARTYGESWTVMRPKSRAFGRTQHGHNIIYIYIYMYVYSPWTNLLYTYIYIHYSVFEEQATTQPLCCSLVPLKWLFSWWFPSKTTKHGVSSKKKHTPIWARPNIESHVQSRKQDSKTYTSALLVAPVRSISRGQTRKVLHPLGSVQAAC